MNKYDLVVFTVLINSVFLITMMTLSPFDFHIETTVRGLDYRFFLIGLGESSWLDVRNNLILFFPFGFSIAWLQQLGWLPRMSGFAGMLFLSLLFSYTIELLQLFVPVRFPSLIDIFSNIAGAAVGYLALRLVVNSCKESAASFLTVDKVETS
jgi:glycopeptide antibiotics resistance protein